MSLFSNQYKEGKGVRKNEPVKKPFFRFWELFGRKFWNLVTLNLLYLLMCLPVVTIGAATAAFTYVLRNYALGRPVFLKDDFFTAFKNNWKQATVVFFIHSIIVMVDCFAIYFYYAIVSALETTDINFYIYMAGLVVCLCILLISTFMSYYIYLMMVSFDFKLKSLMKNAFYFSGIGIKANFICLFSSILFIIIGILLILSNYLLPLGVMYFLLLSGPFCGFLIVFCTFPIVKKYIIDPYYEETGLPNPLDENPEEEEVEAVFQDDVTQKYEEEQIKKNFEDRFGRK